MLKSILKTAVELELQWLKYYSFSKSKENLDFSRSLYDQLELLGYSKKNIDLDKRCAFLRLSSHKRITRFTKLEDIAESGLYRDNINNIYTALEVWLILYPEDKDWVLNQLI